MQSYNEKVIIHYFFVIVMIDQSISQHPIESEF